jgi:predicted RND superfamily exporter protein
MSFLPVARSSATLEYFHALQTGSGTQIGDDRTEIIAMDLGLKETLFNEYLFEDSIYLGIALLLISLAILFYTQSVFITLSTLLAITYSLAWAYFIYTFILGIKFFPFMNILAAVIAIGVGADDTFILVKAWNAQTKVDPNLSSLDEQLEAMVKQALGHAVLTMCVTSFTTAAAFFASYISSITAIKCFRLVMLSIYSVLCRKLVPWII